MGVRWARCTRLCCVGKRVYRNGLLQTAVQWQRVLHTTNAGQKQCFGAASACPNPLGRSKNFCRGSVRLRRCAEKSTSKVSRLTSNWLQCYGLAPRSARAFGREEIDFPVPVRDRLFTINSSLFYLPFCRKGIAFFVCTTRVAVAFDWSKSATGQGRERAPNEIMFFTLAGEREMQKPFCSSFSGRGMMVDAFSNNYCHQLY